MGLMESLSSKSGGGCGPFSRLHNALGLPPLPPRLPAAALQPEINLVETVMPPERLPINDE
jgi:hypothetical protein